MQVNKTGLNNRVIRRENLNKKRCSIRISTFIIRKARKSHEMSQHYDPGISTRRSSFGSHRSTPSEAKTPPFELSMGLPPNPAAWRNRPDSAASSAGELEPPILTTIGGTVPRISSNSSTPRIGFRSPTSPNSMELSTGSLLSGPSPPLTRRSTGQSGMSIRSLGRSRNASSVALTRTNTALTGENSLFDHSSDEEKDRKKQKTKQGRMRKRVSQTFKRVSALFFSKTDSEGSANQRHAISYPTSPANTLQPSLVGADNAASVINPNRLFPYETKCENVPYLSAESNTSQVDLAFPLNNPVSEQSNAALWRLEEDEDEPSVSTNTSQPVKMYHDPSKRLFRLEEALTKMTCGTTSPSAKTSNLSSPFAKAGPSTSPPTQHRPVSINSMNTEVTEFVDEESIDEYPNTEALSFEPTIAAYRSPHRIFHPSPEVPLSPIRGNIPIVLGGVKMNLRIDDGETSSGSEDGGRGNKESAKSEASDDLGITLGSANDTPGDLGSLDAVTDSKGNQKGFSTSTGLGKRRSRIPAPLNFMTN
ncbi:hypothetical protein C364_06779 [Cryptococcus neoformans Bt63]|nr:hypothetical protein C364_06779 [Cryptococcus neoformans var. grubii Bt63]